MLKDKNTVFLGIRIPQSYMKLLQKEADAKDRSISYIARQKILYGLIHNQEKYGIDDLLNLLNDDNLKDYIKIHYEIYSKEDIAKVLSELLNTIDEFIYTYHYCNEDEMKNFIKTKVKEGLEKC